MSIHVVNWVIENSPQKGGALTCLLMIAWHAERDGTNAFPKISRLAEECRMNERHVRRLVDHLEAAGAILVERGRGRSRGHRFTIVTETETGHPDRFSEGKPDILTGITPIKPDILTGIETENRTSVTENRTSVTEAQERARVPSLEPSLLLTPAAEALDAVLGAFTARGYATDARFLSVLGRTYPDLNLELEALKLAEWLTEPRNRKRPCSRKFIDNWLKKAEADRREREQLTLRALGPSAPRGSGGAVVNGTYHPPAAFQRNPNPEADLPEWDEERAERSAAEKARVKQLLLTHRRHTA